MAKEKVLIVDDEQHIVELIKYNLEAEGYKIIEAYDGEEALKKVELEYPDIILLDLMIPKINGSDVCRTLRSGNDTKNIPVIMITAKGEEIDRILGLEIGADDYITKPFSVRELCARVKAVLRRMTMIQENKIMKIGDLQINFSKYEVTKNGEKVELTLKEFELLSMLIKNRGNVLNRDQLLDTVWGYEYIGETRTVDVHIRHLRKKLEDDDKNPKYIETVRGLGYRFSFAGE